MSGESRSRPSDGVVGIDHLALPMERTDDMVAFYRSLGLEVTETPHLVRVQLGAQMINFHRPELWKRGFELRASSARPPCGDLCLVWGGPAPALRALLERASATIVEGPVERQGGRGTAGTSLYVRDPDGNLVEFIAYPEEWRGS